MNTGMTGHGVIRKLDELIADVVRNRREWENNTVEDYLEAMMGWLEDKEEMLAMEHPSWELLVKLLEIPKYYEWGMFAP